MPSKAALRASAAMKKDGPQPLSDDVRKPLISTASAIAEEEISKCNLFDKEEMELISRFEEKGNDVINIHIIYLAHPKNFL